MRRIDVLRFALAAIVAAALVVAVSNVALAATWHKLGTSGFTAAPNSITTTDMKRIKFNSVVTDNAGNVFSTAVNWNNNGTAGGLTIYKKLDTGSYQTIDVDLNALGYSGGVTKLVVGGDGAVYGLQNWLEIQWPYNSGVSNRIIKIDTNGGVTEIVNAGAASDSNRIGGMTVGADGNIYYTLNGATTYGKFHYLWRYNTTTGQIEEAPINSTNNGWSETHRMFDLEWVGGQNFNILTSGSSNWRQDPIGWETNRTVGASSNPGWGRDWITATAYDPINRALWVGGRGSSNTSIMTRFNNITDGVAQSQDVFHATNSSTAGANGGDLWVASIAIDPRNGNAWMGFGGVTSYVKDRGQVMVRGTDLSYWSEGTPEEGADVVGLTFGEGAAYALVFNRTTGEYSTYYAAVPEPSALLAMVFGLAGWVGRKRRRV